MTLQPIETTVQAAVPDTSNGDTSTAHVIDRAVEFLLQQRSAAGWWTDFDTLAGSSTEWVSAFVAVALARSRRPRAVAAARQTWLRLRRTRWWSSGWGFNLTVPSDADSTVWVLHLGSALGERIGGRSLRFLGRHVTSSGALTTYASAGPIRAFTRLSGESFAGWCGSHACVTGAAALLPQLPDRERALAWLRSAQCRSGEWRAYWWPSRHYATALAAEALALASGAGDADRVRRAASWAAADIRRQGAASPFDRAFALRTLLLDPDSRRTAASQLDALARAQRDDGSWPPSARLRIPPPAIVEPDEYPVWIEGGRGGGSVQSDRHALFTTSAVVQALVAAERQVLM